MFEVIEKVAIKQRFPLLGKTQGVVNFGARFVRHHAAQKLHISRWHLHVHHEVGPRKAEEDKQVVLAKKRGINDQLALLIVQNRQGEWHLYKAIDHLADQICTLVPIEQSR